VVQPVRKVLLGQQDHKAYKVLLVSPEQLDHKVKPDQLLLVRKVLLVRKDNKVLLVSLEQLVRQVHVEQLVRKVIRVRPVLQGLLDQLVNMA
jgi:hypothetical protein